jgi:tetratricopeptide (TPR) repeat protein
MGISYIKLKEYQKAIDAFKKATKVKPDSRKALVYNAMGVAYHNKSIAILRSFSSRIFNISF